MSESEPKKVPTISRRRFIGIIGGIVTASVVGSDLINAHGSTFPAVSRGLVEGLESGTLGMDAEQMSEELEYEYGVRLIKASDDLIFPNLSEKQRTAADNRVNWDPPRIKALHDVLAVLPENFYKPREVNEEQMPLAFVLAGRIPSEPGKLSVGSYHHPNEQFSGLIFYNRQALGQSFLEQERSDRGVIHEIVHHVTDPRLHQLQSRLANVLNIRDTGQLNATFKTEMLEDYRKQTENSNGLEITHAKKQPGLSQLQRELMYGGTSFKEFFPVAATVYCSGRSEFIKNYSHFLNPNQAEKLYDLMKNEVYEGREY